MGPALAVAAHLVYPVGWVPHEGYTKVGVNVGKVLQRPNEVLKMQAEGGTRWM